MDLISNTEKHNHTQFPNAVPNGLLATSYIPEVYILLQIKKKKKKLVLLISTFRYSIAIIEVSFWEEGKLSFALSEKKLQNGSDDIFVLKIHRSLIHNSWKNLFYILVIGPDLLGCLIWLGLVWFLGLVMVKWVWWRKAFDMYKHAEDSVGWCYPTSVSRMLRYLTHEQQNLVIFLF